MEQAALSSSFLLEQVPTIDRYSILEAAVVAAPRITYGAALEGWVRVRSEQVDGLISEAELSGLRSVLAGRIRDAAAGGDLLHQDQSEDAWWLYQIWLEEDPSSLHEYLAENVVARGPEGVLEFVGCALGAAWNLETGVRSRAEFGESHYDVVSEMIEVDRVAAAARDLFGDELADPDYYGDTGRSPVRSLAHPVHGRPPAQD